MPAVASSKVLAFEKNQKVNNVTTVFFLLRPQRKDSKKIDTQIALNN